MVNNIETIKNVLETTSKKLYYVSRPPIRTAGKSNESSRSLTRLQSSLSQSVRLFAPKKVGKKLPSNFFDLVRVYKSTQRVANHNN